MSQLDAVCPTCKQRFNNADDVYSTRCGHLFHLACTTQWKYMVTSCPRHCHLTDPQPHKLYFSFDGPDTVLQDIQAKKLETSNERITELQVQNSELELDFLRIQENYTAVEEAKLIMKEKVKRNNDSEMDLIRLQAQYTESAEEVKNMEYRIEELNLANETKTNELQILISENEFLKSGQNVNQTTMPETIMNQRIKNLEQKLNIMSEKLKTEINTSTNLSIDKMKLESYLKNLNVNPNQKNPIIQNFNEDRKDQKENENPVFQLKQNQTETDTRNSCIIIRNLPKCLMVTPLELIVINLAIFLKMSISSKDLLKVNFLDETKQDLLVKFRSSELKETFLAKKVMLNRDPLRATMHIREFMAENVYELYKYAKLKLQGRSFHCIYCVNNKIFAKRDKRQFRAQEIKSKQEVDKLLSNRNRTTDSTKETNKGPIIDENYYQL